MDQSGLLEAFKIAYPTRQGKITDSKKEEALSFIDEIKNTYLRERGVEGINYFVWRLEELKDFINYKTK